MLTWLTNRIVEALCIVLLLLLLCLTLHWLVICHHSVVNDREGTFLGKENMVNGLRKKGCSLEVHSCLLLIWDMFMDNLMLISKNLRRSSIQRLGWKLIESGSYRLLGERAWF